MYHNLTYKTNETSQNQKGLIDFKSKLQKLSFIRKVQE